MEKRVTRLGLQDFLLKMSITETVVGTHPIRDQLRFACDAKTEQTLKCSKI